MFVIVFESIGSKRYIDWENQCHGLNSADIGRLCRAGEVETFEAVLRAGPGAPLGQWVQGHPGPDGGAHQKEEAPNRRQSGRRYIGGDRLGARQ